VSHKENIEKKKVVKILPEVPEHMLKY